MDESNHTKNLGSNSVQQQQPVVGESTAAYQFYYQYYYQQFVQYFDTLARNYSSLPGQITPANPLVPMFLPMPPQPFQLLSPQIQAHMNQWCLTGFQYANPVPSGLNPPPQNQFINLLLQQGDMNLYNYYQNRLLINQLNILSFNQLFGGPSLMNVNQPQVNMFTNQPNAGMNQPVEPMDVSSSGQDQSYSGWNQPQMDGNDPAFADWFEPAPLCDDEDMDPEWTTTIIKVLREMVKSIQ